MNKPACENCRFSVRTYTGDTACRRHAPATVSHPQCDHYGSGKAKWPIVDSRDWCGDHAPVPTPTWPEPLDYTTPGVQALIDEARER